jgi:hypothetical protein
VTPLGLEAAKGKSLESLAARCGVSLQVVRGVVAGKTYMSE